MNTSPNKILRLNEVTVLTGLSRSTIYLYIKKGKFPAPAKIGLKAVGWSENEIFTWIGEALLQRLGNEP